TSADAYMLGYDVVVAKEATNAFTEEDYVSGLAYLKTCYGADAEAHGHPEADGCARGIQRIRHLAVDVQQYPERVHGPAGDFHQHDRH
ncbi:MAG: hypothetical protein IKT07_10915, partial [Oscillospiraceae bacterium]|nr:hypothetical protein [Oscillospiraceae bacterium]